MAQMKSLQMQLAGPTGASDPKKLEELLQKMGAGKAPGGPQPVPAPQEAPPENGQAPQAPQEAPTPAGSAP
jgi:hypothetical protein